jgi:hypothetical protein
MAHPHKRDTEASHDAKLKAMTEHYGRADPKMVKFGQATKYKISGPEDDTGFGADIGSVVLLQTHANELTVAGFHTLSHGNADRQKSQRRTTPQPDAHSIAHHCRLNRRTRDDGLQSYNPSM